MGNNNDTGKHLMQPIDEKPTNAKILQEIKSLKGMYANQGKLLKDHGERLASIETARRDESIAKKAVAEFVAQAVKDEKIIPTDNTWLTKELLRAIIGLIGIIGVLAAIIQVGKTIK